LDRVGARQRGKLGASVEWELAPQRQPRQRPVHRPRVEVAKADARCERARDGALAGAGRSVDGDDHAGVDAVRSESSRSKKPGKLTATDSAPRTSTPSRDASPATAPSIAMR